MKTYAVADFETASACDLKKCGAAVYARHPTTEILTLGISVGGGAPIYITPAELCQPDLKPSLLRVLVDDQQVRFVCHGAQFERNIWTHIMVAQFGWPELPIARWHDTMAVAFSKGLPGKLEILTKLLNLPEQKDTEGSRLTISLSKPNKKTGMLDRSPASLARVGQYVLSDCIAENQLLLMVNGFDGNERAVWELDQKINDRGVKIDRAYVNAGIAICERVVPQVVNQFRDLTGCAPTQRDKVMKWMVDQGLKLKDLRKETIEKLLGEAEDAEASLSDQDTPDEELQLALDVGIPPQCKTALRWRGLTTSASVKKLPTMLGVMCPEDDRARGLLQYHGAGPGRWAGRILQPHNFPRGFAHDIDDLVGGILAQDVGYLTAVYGNPIEAVSTGLRHALVAGDDTEFHLGDFTQIEARIVLALAGATKGLEAFMRGKPYVEMAESIFKQKVDKHQNIREYTIGKNTILGCFGANTLVLTDRGFIPILLVSTDDLVWDGLEWVTHDGVIDQGERETIFLGGVSVTPEHKILSGEQWLPAERLVQDEREFCRALANGSENLPSSDISTERAGGLRPFEFDALADVGRMASLRLTSSLESPPDATLAQSSGPQRLEKSIGDTLISFLMTMIAPGFSTGLAPAFRGVTIRRTGLSSTTAGAAFLYMGLGGKIVESFLNTCSRFPAGMIRLWSWTAQKMISATSREISSSQPAAATWPIEELSRRYRPASMSLKRVYDVANAGPRNRFTILTERGLLNVHNCGFQMGAKTFRARYCPDETPEFAQRAIDTYRKDFAPEVPDLWYGLERAALNAIWENRPTEAYGVLYERNGTWLTARLPSGRKLWYYGPQPIRKAMPWDANDIRPAWTSLAYKTGRLVRRDMYGGLLTENVVQGLARDLLVEAMFRCEQEGMKIVLTVHDEIVDESRKSVKLLEQCMTTRSRWAEKLNIPIGVELASGQRYRK